MNVDELKHASLDARTDEAPSGLERALREGRFPVSLEVTPPREPRPDLLWRRASALQDVAAVHCIQRPDRLSSVTSCRVLAGMGIEGVWHLVNRGRGRGEIARELARGRAAGVRTLVCMRGDHVAGDHADTPSLRETVAMARDALPGAFVGATFNPYADPERALANLGPKLEAGARWVVTQPAFEPERLQPLRRFLAGRAFLVPTCMPVLSVEAALSIQKRLRLPLPGALLGALRDGGADAGWRCFEDALAALREIADGCAIVTPTADLSRSHAERIQASLRRVRGR